jgi:glutathione synthase
MFDWPPQLPKEKLNQLSSIAIDWATLNGLVIRSMTNDIPTAVHAPFSLFPCPFPLKPFERAIKLQPLFNLLVDKVARDDEFLCSIMDSLSTADEFTNQIYQIYLKTRHHPQSIWMGIHRSDYMLDSIDEELGIKQVELNTISSSFSSLSSKTRDLHEYLSVKTGFFNELTPNQIDIKANMLPSNTSGTSIAKALAKAHDAYGVESYFVC